MANVHVSLSMTEGHHAALIQHLFPEDGCEAVALALCARAASNARHKLLVRRIELVPYDVCSVRTPHRVTWPTSVLVPLLEEAARNNWAVVKIHGHWNFEEFSSTDDVSDRELFPSVYAWTDSVGPHGSAIVMRTGRVFGRVVSDEAEFFPFDAVFVVGDDLQHFPGNAELGPVPEFGRRVAQSFGQGTYARLRKLRVAVVGCSGTGSPVIEQLARNCVGSLVLVDPDRIEEKNLNRILNSTMKDAKAGTPKVEVAKRAIAAMGLGTEVETYCALLFSPEVVRAVASCDVIMGCVDSIDARFLLNKLATFYLIPYIDLGVKIEADGKGGVDQVCGSVHFLKPGGSSLQSRHLFTMEQVRAAGLHRTNPEQYEQLLDAGYIRGVREDQPAVIQLNTLIASLGISELLARLHPYRMDPNGDFAITRISLTHGIFDHESDGEPCPMLMRHVGRGDVEPLLEWPELSEKKGS